MSTAAARETASDLVGSRYQLLNELAHGGTGTVYRALDRLTGRVITLKRLRGEVPRVPEDSVARLELAHEFRLLASLRHPNIIGVLDYGFDDGNRPFLTMELAEGAGPILHAGRNQPFGVQVDLLVQTLRALSYVHHRGIIHRDIKPANILVRHGEVKLLDFGLSLYSAGPVDAGESAAGTVAYFAPEILLGAAPGVASDLFAFGVVMYEMLAGKHPFDPDDKLGFWQRLSASRPPLPVEGIDPRLEGVIERLLARDPAARYGDAAEVIAAMASALDRDLPVETVASRESFLQSAAFVGRVEEIRVLGDALVAAIAGHGSTFLVGGESGVGKSRLLEELRCQALIRGVVIARGQASANGGEPYGVWREVLRSLVIAAEGIGDRLAGDLKILVPDIDGLLGFAVPPADADPDGIPSRLIVALEELLDRIHRPIAIVLEDLQWADSASIKLLAAAARSGASRRVMLIGAFRDDEANDLPSAIPGARVLALARLDGAETEQLAASMIGSAGREPKLVEFLLRQTEGIPFFLVELVRSMAEEAGALARIASSVSASVGTSEGTRRLLKRRLSRVPAEARSLLELAAVVGREVDIELLEPFRNGISLNAWCTQLVANGVFSAEEDRFRFAHDKLREHVLDDLGTDRRRSLHREVAEQIERSEALPERYLAALAHHWSGAGDRAREGIACERAGDQALRSGACAEAARFYERALAAMELPPDPSSPARRGVAGVMNPNLRVDPNVAAFRAARLEAGLTESHFRLGSFNECRVHAQRAMKLCNVAMPTSAAGIRAGIVRQLATRLLQTTLRFRSRDADSAQVAREMVRVQAYLYEVCFFALEPVALVWSVLAMANHCSPLGPSPALARAHMALALISGAAGLHPLAKRWCRSSISIAQQVCSKSERAYLLNRVNNYRFACCDWETADREIAMAAELAEESGDRRIWEEARSMQGMSDLFQGRFASGVQAWSEVQGSTERSGNIQIECWSLMGQADNLVRLGRDDEAVRLYNRALERFAGRAHTTESIWAKGMLALACLRTGDDASAERYARETLELLRSARPMAYWTQFGTAATLEVFLTLAERMSDDAIGRSSMLRKAEHARASMRDFARAFPMGRPFHLLLEGRYQKLRGRDRRAMRLWRRCVSVSQTLGTPYELGRACLALAIHSPEQSVERRRYLEWARETFLQCGASRELAEASSVAAASQQMGHGNEVIV